jgi:hypothetical protein
MRALPGATHDRLYERSWVLVRPDGHVAWRGEHLPGEAAALADTVLGFRDGKGA